MEIRGPEHYKCDTFDRDLCTSGPERPVGNAYYLFRKFKSHLLRTSVGDCSFSATLLHYVAAQIFRLCSQQRTCLRRFTDCWEIFNFVNLSLNETCCELQSVFSILFPFLVYQRSLISPLLFVQDDLFLAWRTLCYLFVFL